MNLEVESRHVEMTPRWKQEIEERIAALQRGTTIWSMGV